MSSTCLSYLQICYCLWYHWQIDIMHFSSFNLLTIGLASATALPGFQINLLFDDNDNHVRTEDVKNSLPFSFAIQAVTQNSGDQWLAIAGGGLHPHSLLFLGEDEPTEFILENGVIKTYWPGSTGVRLHIGQSFNSANLELLPPGFPSIQAKANVTGVKSVLKPQKRNTPFSPLTVHD